MGSLFHLSLVRASAAKMLQGRSLQTPAPGCLFSNPYRMGSAWTSWSQSTFDFQERTIIARRQSRTRRAWPRVWMQSLRLSSKKTQIVLRDSRSSAPRPPNPWAGRRHSKSGVGKRTFGSLVRCSYSPRGSGDPSVAHTADTPYNDGCGALLGRGFLDCWGCFDLNPSCCSLATDFGICDTK